MSNNNQECKCTHIKSEHKKFLFVIPTKCKQCKCDDFMKKDYDGKYEKYLGTIYIILASFVVVMYFINMIKTGSYLLENSEIVSILSIIGIIILFKLAGNCFSIYKKIKNRKTGIVE